NLPPGELLVPAGIFAKHPLLSKCIGLSIGVSTDAEAIEGKPTPELSAQRSPTEAEPAADGPAASNPAAAKAPAVAASQWLVLRFSVGIQRWTIGIKALESGRFPNVDQCMPGLTSSRSIIHIADNDASYLIKRLARLMG